MKMLGFLALLGLGLVTAPAHAQDHPLVGHLDGATAKGYQVLDFDEARIITGPIDEMQSRAQEGPGWQTFEGKIFRIYHRLPDGLSSLAALRSYEKGLKEKGFDIAFTCGTEAGTCFTDGIGRAGLYLGLALDGRVDMPKLEAGDYIRNLFYTGNGRYLLATLDRPEGSVYVSLAISDANAGRHVIAQIIETGDLQTSSLNVTSSNELGDRLASDGKVDIYGILFDFDRADIKPESAAQIQAIAELLTRQPDLKLQIVGHTDNEGSASYNLDLSTRRAQAVRAALVSGQGIDPARLTAHGVGLSQPVASNDDEAGRAKNRRVELNRL